jgi:uncharacterized protein (DUF1778 family)
MAKKQKTVVNAPKSFFQKIFNSFNDIVQNMNNSKIFAGVMIITLNIASKFVNIKLGKTMEAYLKYSFSRQILVFAIAWMGTRDIYVAFLMTILFTIATEFLFHEDSQFFILSQETKEHYCNLLDNPPEKVTEEDVKKAKEVLEKAEKQKKETGADVVENKGDAVNIKEKIQGNTYDTFSSIYGK